MYIGFLHLRIFVSRTRGQEGAREKVTCGVTGCGVCVEDIRACRSGDSGLAGQRFVLNNTEFLPGDHYEHPSRPL